AGRACADDRSRPDPEPRAPRDRHAGMSRPGRVLALALLLVGLAACSPSAIASLFPDANRPLATVTTRGGLCADGPCGDSVSVDRDGNVRSAAKPPNALGTVPPDQLRALAAAIATTDFEAIRAHPFTGGCPTAVDGQEFVFEFGTPSGPERLATCESDIDFGQPLFVALSTALGPFIAVPTT